MGFDHDFYIVLASKYQPLRAKFIETYGPKDGQKDIAKSNMDAIHPGMTKEQISSKLSEVFKAMVNESFQSNYSYEHEKNFSDFLHANTIFVKSIRDYLLKTNTIDSFEFYSAGGGLYYTVSTKAQVVKFLQEIKPQSIGYENEAINLLAHILQMLDNIGEECYVIMETSY